jgi:four helix bundle protein
MRDFRELAVWVKAHSLTLEVYGATRSFPADERFGLTAQLRRAAASIPTNIAEGCGRGGEREFARCLSIAAGSASETEYQLLLACELGYLTSETHDRLQAQVNEVQKMLGAFHRRLAVNG